MPTIYSTVDIKRDWQESLDWIPIDDGEVTILHKMAQVSPCAFPQYRGQTLPSGKKKNRKRAKGPQPNTVLPKDDRRLILERIEFKKQQHQMEEDKRIKLIKCLKRRRKTEKQKLEKTQQAKVNKDISLAETLDPYCLFDPSGNVSISALVASSGTFSETKLTKSEPIESTSASTNASPDVAPVETSGDATAAERPAENPQKYSTETCTANAVEIDCDKFNAMSVDKSGVSVEPLDVALPQNSSLPGSPPAEGLHITESITKSENESQLDLKEADMSAAIKIAQIDLKEADEPASAEIASRDIVDYSAVTDIFAGDLEFQASAECNRVQARKKAPANSNIASSPSQTITRSGRIVKPKRK